MSHRVTVARGAHSPHHAFTGIPALFKAGRRGRPAFVARADRLHAVPQAELAQDATEAGLHGALREEQPRLRPSTYTSRPTATEAADRAGLCALRYLRHCVGVAAEYCIDSEAVCIDSEGGVMR